MDDNTDQATYWNEVAGAKWVANQVRLDRVFAPLTTALTAGAALRQGEYVVDVGCGCGQTSLLHAARVGANGRVLAVDLSQPMLDHARTRVAPDDAGHAPIDWVRADASTYPFPPMADLVTSRFGVMFFSDQAAAFHNLRGALKPGGRLAMLCWQPRAAVEWMQWPLDVIASVLPPPEQSTGQPGPFGLADPVTTSTVLREAGFAAVEAQPVVTPVTLGEGADAVEEAFALVRDTGPAAAALREAEPDARAAAETLLRAALASRLRDGAVRLDAACWLYLGRA